MSAAESEPWVMPEWMEPYRSLFQNTGGNEIEWLMGPQADSNAHTNIIRAALIASVESQITLLHRLRHHGMLTTAPAVPSPHDRNT